jgi:hypothetical protein
VINLAVSGTQVWHEGAAERVRLRFCAPLVISCWYRDVIGCEGLCTCTCSRQPLVVANPASTSEKSAQNMSELLISIAPLAVVVCLARWRGSKLVLTSPWRAAIASQWDSQQLLGAN